MKRQVQFGKYMNEIKSKISLTPQQEMHLISVLGSFGQEVADVTKDAVFELVKKEFIGGEG